MGSEKPRARCARPVCCGGRALAAAALCLLGACGGGRSSPLTQAPSAESSVPVSTASPAAPPSPRSALAELERSGALPRLDRSDSLAGPDDDRNGVRDDIDAYIARSYADPGQRAAALQLARALQAAVVLNSPEKEPNRLVGQQMSRATYCTGLRFSASGTPNFHTVGRELEAITANTKARLKAYLQHNKALDGTAWALPREDTCE